MSFFNVNIEGLDSLDKDFEKHQKAIEKRIPMALRFVAGEMIADLQRHIMDDFYEAYTPKDYERRLENYPNLGTPMILQENMQTEIEGNVLSFTYSPKTEHADLDNWVQDKPVKGTFPLSARTGDDLIIWGQMAHYRGRIPARPFWNLFVEEQRDKKILDNFIFGMGAKYPVEKEPKEVAILEDGELLPSDEAQTRIGFHSNSDLYDDDELPL